MNQIGDLLQSLASRSIGRNECEFKAGMNVNEKGRMDWLRLPQLQRGESQYLIKEDVVGRAYRRLTRVERNSLLY